MIEGTKKLGDWGKKTPASETSHVTQTNSNSDDGKAAHITTNIPGERAKVHDRFDKDGNYLDTTFGKR